MTNLQPVDPSVLVAPMLARFMASDRAFAKARRAAHQDMLPCLLCGPSPGISYALVVGLHRNGITPPAAPA